MKIVFLGRKCHIATQSDLFLLEILRELGDVKLIRREEFSEEQCLEQIKSHHPDVVIFFQTRPSIKHHLWGLRGVRKIWVPMWEATEPLPRMRRLAHRMCGVETISFCEELHDFFIAKGMHSLLTQYFPKPDLSKISHKLKPPYTVFCWQREPQIGLHTIQKFFPDGAVGKVIYKTDRPVEALSSFPFEIEHLQGWLPKETILEKIQQADYYVAPRSFEGIGFSFLEAQALGKIVISYNGATMNEYIQDGVNGHLFNKNGPMSQPWLPPAQMKEGVVQAVESAHSRWLRDRERLIQFLVKDKGKSYCIKHTNSFF